MVSDTLREKEDELAGVKKYVVSVSWYDDGLEHTNTVFVKASSPTEAREKSIRVMEEDLLLGYMDASDDAENFDFSGFGVSVIHVIALENVEYPSVY